MKIELKIEGASPEQIRRYTEILTILLTKGALDGVRGGSTIIHFDGEGVFQGIELDYWPWRRRRRVDRL